MEFWEFHYFSRIFTYNGNESFFSSGRRWVAPQQVRKLASLPATQQEPNLLLIGQIIHVTSLAFTWYDAECNKKEVADSNSVGWNVYHNDI